MRSYVTRSSRVSRRDRRVRLHLEALEDRTLLNANSLLATNTNVSVLSDNQAAAGDAHPTFEIVRPASQSLSQPADAHGPSGGGGPTPGYDPGQSPGGYWPSQLRHAYGFDKLSLDGSGQTIAIVDAYDDPNIANDLAAFDAQFNLPAPPSFLRYDEYGNLNPSAVPPDPSGGWEVEEALDVEWAHAIAPKANIILVEGYSSSYGDLLSAVDYARNFAGGTINGVIVAPTSVVSMSWGGSEDPSEIGADAYFTTPAGHTGVTFVASSGDGGAPGGYPAMSPNVLAVGGTTLALDSSDNRTSEVGWSGSGGGPSSLESEPGYQSTYAQSSYVQNTLGNTVLLNSTRGNPDVSYDADPNTGVAMYDTYPNQYGINGWAVVGGTSDAAPQWAGLVALADQGRGAAGSLDGATQTLPRLYQLAANSTSYSNDFFDVTSGSNGYSAQAGYDFVTGLGSPRADHLVPDLIGNQGPVSFSVTTSTGTPVAGAPFSVTVTALDSSGHTFTGYTGTVHFTTTDTGAGVKLPADYTFTTADKGVHTFTNGVTLVTAGAQTVTVTDSTNNLTGQASVNVGAAAASTLTVSAPASVTEDSPFTLTVTAKDPYGNTATGYRGTVQFTTTDTGTGVVLPSDYTFSAGDNGVHTFTNGVTLVTLGAQTVTATDTTTKSIAGQASVNVTQPQATHFLVSAPAGSTAGAAFSITVTALDANNNAVPGYLGTVHFTTTDTGTGVVLPSDYTFSAGDNGVHTFTNGVTLVTAGAQTVTVTDTTNSGLTGQASVNVSAAAASTLVLSAPASVTQGSPFTLTVTAKDPYGNTATGYRGTVQFTTTDTGTGVVLPSDYTFSAGDNGVHTFTNGVTLVTVGAQTVTATDTTTGSITGQASVNVTPKPSGNLIVNGGFETGDFTGWMIDPDPYSSYFGVNNANPHSGNYAAFFGAFFPFGGDYIYQDVPTIPGHTYQISYWVANGYTVPGGYTEIQSSWGGTVLEDLYPDSAFPYEQHTFNVTANSTSTEFRIGGYQVLDYWYLDDVSVTDTTAAAASQVVRGADIANSNMVNGGNNIGAFGANQGGSSPSGAGPVLATPFDLGAASLLPAISPSWTSLYLNSTPASALSTGKLPGQEVAAVDRLFASLPQGDAAFGLSAAMRYAPSEVYSWPLDPR